jgi:hypothetical protein
MTRAQRRFDSRFKRLRALLAALSVTLFAIVAQAQQTTDKTQSTSATPAQIPQKKIEARRIHAVRVTDAIKIDGLLDEPAVVGKGCRV